VDAILSWTSLSETARRKLLWDNAVRCYRRYGARAASQPSAAAVPTPA
jgi:hypothetical protein